MSQIKKSVPKSTNIPVEMSLVDRVLITLMSCGRKDTVVSVAPIKPRAIIKFILFCLLRKHIFTLFLLDQVLAINQSSYLHRKLTLSDSHLAVLKKLFISNS